MFPLSGKNFPTDPQVLADSIREALAAVLSLPDGGKAVKVEGAELPQLKRIKVDLSGAEISATEPPPKPKPSGKRTPGLHVTSLEVVGHPIKYEKNKLDLTLKARDVSCDFARDKKGNAMLVLADAREGSVEAKMSKADIEALLKRVAEELAKEQKVTVQDLKLTLTSSGPRSVAADVRITARKMLVSGTIVLKGRLDVDDELNATLSELSASGDGMVGSMVAGLVHKKVKPHEGRVIPLMAFSLGDVALRDLKITVKKDVQVNAAFGSGNGR